jgi:diguanylate cyclase (GGDEF)-like protein
MAMSPIHRLGDLWLGTEPAQRLRLRQTTLAMALMGLCVPMLHYAVGVAHEERGALLWAWTAGGLGGMGLIYILIRSGWSRRLADPSLTSVQIAFAITAGAAGYALAGPLRGATFPVLTLILMFGMFQLRARTAFALSFFALALFGLAMAVMSQTRPQAYPPEVEFGHFLMLAVMLPAVAVLTARLSGIRHRLQQQKQALREALEQIQEMATRDALTGLINRRQMQQLLERETRRCARTGASYCLAMLDLDHFKQVNDMHGHGIGDLALCAFANMGSEVIRQHDVLARWGGEEFLLMLVDTGMPAARAGLERLRERVAAMEIPTGAQPLRLSFSAGLTEYRPGESLVQALERADQLLYQAKAAGRPSSTL